MTINMRVLRLTLYFVVGLLLGAVATFSQAETIAATMQAGTAVELFTPYSSAQAACEGLLSSKGWSGPVEVVDQSDMYVCRGYASWAPGVLQNGGSVFKQWQCPGSTVVYDGRASLACDAVPTCPLSQNWTLSGTTCTRPDCDAGQTRQSDGTCKAACLDGSLAGSGLYDIGTAPTGSLGKLYCNSGCEVMIGEGSSPVASAVVSGVTHYYGRARYDYTGDTCTGGTSVSDGLQSPPTDTCGAGQGRATMNGKTICIDDAGNPVDTRAPTTTGERERHNTDITNPDGTTSTSEEQVRRETTCTGDRCTTREETTTGGGGAGGGSGGGGTTVKTTEESRDSYCQKNPKSAQCTDGSGSTTGEDEDGTDAGAPASTEGLYTKGTRTAAQAFNDFGNKARSAGFVSAASHFFEVSVPSGSCSDLSLSVDVGWGASYSIDMTPVFCGSLSSQVFGLLGIGVMLAAVWVAFKIALL